MSRRRRLAAAQEAAVAFIGAQPDNVDVGVVAFDQGALTTSLPTADHEAAVAAVGRLQTAGGTSLAAAILTSLSAITGRAVGDRPQDGSRPTSATGARRPSCCSPTGRIRPGGRRRARGDRRQTAGVHIDTVGVGTAAGTTVEVDGFQVATALDADCSPTIAQTTSGAVPPGARSGPTAVGRHGASTCGSPFERGVPLAGAFTGFALLLLGAGGLLTMMRTGTDPLMSFSWPWALIALLVLPLVLLACLVDPTATSAGCGAAVTAIALIRAALPGRSPLAPPDPAAAVRDRPGPARHRGGPAAGDGAGRVEFDVDHAGAGHLGVDVFDRRRRRTGSPSPRRPPVSFVRAQEGGARIGLVTFAGVAGLLVAPTDDTEELIAAIEGLSHRARHGDRLRDPDRHRRLAEIDPSIAPHRRRRVGDLVARRRVRADTIVVLTDGREHPGRRPGDRRRRGGRARRARVHHRFRHHHARADGLYAASSGDAASGRRWRSAATGVAAAAAAVTS